MSPESSQEDHDALAERRSDQSVWNGAMGQAALDGFYADKQPSSSPRKKRNPVARNFVAEVDGRTVGLKISNEFAANNPPAENQNEINARGKAIARANIVQGEKRW